MDSNFTAGQKVIAWDNPKKKYETYFLATLEGISLKYVCVNPNSLETYEKDNTVCTLRRFRNVVAVPPKPIFKVGQRVRVLWTKEFADMPKRLEEGIAPYRYGTIQFIKKYVNDNTNIIEYAYAFGPLAISTSDIRKGIYTIEEVTDPDEIETYFL